MARESNDPTITIMGALREELEAARKEIDVLQRENEALEQELDQQDALFADLQSKFNLQATQASEELAAWKARFEEKEQEILYLQSELDGAASDKAVLKGQVLQLERVRKELQSEQLALTERLNQASSELLQKKEEQLHLKEMKEVACLNLKSRLVKLESFLRDRKAALEPFLAQAIAQ